MAHDVFISHSAKDKPLADGICASLEAAGIRCWIAPRDIAYGEDWPTSIANAISKSRVMVLIFSADANASDQISRELSLAADSKLVIIPFKIENVIPEPGKQYYLARTHWLDAMSPPTKEQIQSLVERVSAILPETKPLPESSTATRVARKKERSRLPYLLTLGAVIGLMLIAAVVFTISRSSSAMLASPSSVAIVPIATSAASTPTQVFIPDLTLSPSLLPTATPNATLSPSLLPTATPNATQTSAPSRTVTPSAADQARAFAAPILAAIANKPPNFQDDFSNYNGGWYFLGRDQLGYVDGEFSIVAPPATSSKSSCSAVQSDRFPGFSDLVLEIDGRADLSSQADLHVQFRKGQNGQYVLSIDHNGYLGILRNAQPQDVNLSPQNGYKLHRPSDGNHVQIIAKGSRIAISANGEPIALVRDIQPLQGGDVSLKVCNNSSTQAEARFDNLKIWDISDLPSPP